MLGYKGFNSNMMCRRKQYEIGKSYHEDETMICEKGMHFCTDPLNVLSYYSPKYNNRYCLVEADNVSYEKNEFDSKRVCKDLTIIKEFTRKEYFNEIYKYHNSKNGIIEKDNVIFILSDNNIYNVKRKYKCLCTLCILGNNNIIVCDVGTKIYQHGTNNIVLRCNLTAPKYKCTIYNGKYCIHI